MYKEMDKKTTFPKQIDRAQAKNWMHLKFKEQNINKNQLDTYIWSNILG